MLKLSVHMYKRCQRIETLKCLKYVFIYCLGILYLYAVYFDHRKKMLKDKQMSLRAKRSSEVLSE